MPYTAREVLARLKRAGFRVAILPVIGAGRTLISKGFLSAAKRHAERLRDYPEMETIRQELLRDAIQYYQDFLRGGAPVYFGIGGIVELIRQVSPGMLGQGWRDPSSCSCSTLRVSVASTPVVVAYGWAGCHSSTAWSRTPCATFS